MGLKFDVYVAKLSASKYQMWIKHVKLAETSYGHMMRESFHKNFTKELKYYDNEMMAIDLQMPVIFKKVNGMVSSIHVHKNESLWSINLKKSVLNMMSYNLTEVEEGIKSKKEYNSAVNVEESGIEGRCSLKYQIFPVNNGPCQRPLILDRRDLLRKITQSTTPEVYQVSKILDADDCEDRTIFVGTSLDEMACGDCAHPFKSHSKVSETVKTTYELVKSSGEFVSTRVKTDGEVLTPKLGKHSSVVSTVQRLTLEKIEEKEIPPFYRSSSTNLRSLKYSFSPMMTRSLDSSRRRMSGSEERGLPSNFDTRRRLSGQEWSGESNDLFLQQRGTLQSPVVFSEEDREQFAADILRALKEVSKDILHLRTPLYQKKPLTGVDTGAVTKMIGYLNSVDLYNMYYKNITAQHIPREQRQIERKYFLDCLVMAGTKAAYKLFTTLINDGEIKGAEAVELAVGLPQYALTPNKEALVTLRELCHSRKVSENHYLHSAVCVSLGRIVYKQCSSPYLQQLGKNAFRPKLCNPTYLRRFIIEMGMKIKEASSQQQRAVYLQALGATGSGYAVKFVEPYTRKDKSFLMRASSIIALHDIAVGEPEEVEKIVHHIYQDRQENGKLRILAFNHLFMTVKRFDTWRLIASNLNNETDPQVKSYVYTFMDSFKNTTLPCFKHLALNLTEAIKYTVPFVRNDSFVMLNELMDAQREVSMFLDVGYVGNSSESQTLSYFAFDKVQQLLQAVLENGQVTNNGIKYFKKLLFKTAESSADRRFYRTSSGSANEEIGTVSYHKLYERVLYHYITSADDEQNKRLVNSISNSLVEILKQNYTGTYVKAMLPMNTFASAPTVFGLPMMYGRLNDVVLAVQVKDLSIRVHPQISKIEDLKNVDKVKVSGLVRPLVRLVESEVVGMYNPANMKSSYAGRVQIVVGQFPVKTNVTVEYEKDLLEVRSVSKPHLNQIYVHHESYPFTGTWNYLSFTPYHRHKPAQRIVAPYTYIEFNREFGLDKFGMGVLVTGKFANPWVMHTIPWLKQMNKPFQQLLPSLLKIIENPSLEHREFTVVGVRAAENGTEEIETVLTLSNSTFLPADFKPGSSPSRRRSQEGRERSPLIWFRRSEEEGRSILRATETGAAHYNISGTIIFKGDKERRASGGIICSPKPYGEAVVYLGGVRTPFASNETAPSRITGIFEVQRAPKRNAGIQVSYKSKLMLRWTVNEQPTTMFQIKALHEEEVYDVHRLEQPERALLQVVRKNCEKLETQIQYLPKVCQYALSDKALIHHAVYNYSHVNLRLNLLPVYEYFAQSLYPYTRLTHSSEKIPDGKANAEISTLQGADVTSARIQVDRYVGDVIRFHHESPVVNRLVYYLTEPRVWPVTRRPEIREGSTESEYRELFMDEGYYTSTTQGYSESGGASEGNVERRNRVMERSGRTCFSTRPLSRCVRGYSEERSERRPVDYICFRSGSSRARDLERRAKHEVLRELEREIPSMRTSEEVPTSCS